MITTDPKAKIEQIRARAEKAKMDHARAQTELESIERQREEIREQLAAEGVDESNLDATIEELDKQIADLISEAEALLNQPVQSETHGGEGAAEGLPWS